MDISNRSFSLAAGKSDATEGESGGVGLHSSVIAESAEACRHCKKKRTVDAKRSDKGGGFLNFDKGKRRELGLASTSWTSQISASWIGAGEELEGSDDELEYRR